MFFIIQGVADGWLLVSEPGFSGFWPQIPLETNSYMKKTCREWSEQLDMIDTDYFGFGILQNHQRFIIKWTKLFDAFSLKVFDLL